MIKIEESFLLVEILPIEVEKFNGFGKASGSLQDIAMLPVPFSKRLSPGETFMRERGPLKVTYDKKKVAGDTSFREDPLHYGEEDCGVKPLPCS